LPTDAHYLAAHFAALRDGAVATTGRVTGAGDGFWHRYQTDASLRRERLHARGFQAAGSSQNLGVRAEAFAAIGGFDTRYRQYGFEDRDLLLRLARSGPIAWLPSATVAHRDALRMVDVARKLGEAGCHSSAAFGADHPEAYAALGYARLDVARHAWLRGVASAFGVLVPACARVVDALLSAPLPYLFKAALVRATSAFAFWAGTARSTQAPSAARNV
jgi:hypothetical protein